MSMSEEQGGTDEQRRRGSPFELTNVELSNLGGSGEGRGESSAAD
jgi:hypothetical protein